MTRPVAKVARSRPSSRRRCGSSSAPPRTKCTAIERTAYEYFSPEYQAGWLLEVDVDVTGADLDGPVPDSAFPDSTETHQTALAGYRLLAGDGNPSVREFLYRTVNGWGAAGRRNAGADRRRDRGLVHPTACDGFVLQDSGLPGQFEDFVEQVVPLLRKRGLFRQEYTGTTLRDHLGLAVPANRYEISA